MKKAWLCIVLALSLVLPNLVFATHTEGDLHSDNMRLVGRGEFAYGTDLAFQGNLLVAGSAIWESDDTQDSGIWLYNIANPEKPELISHLNCGAYHADVGIWKDIVVQSHDSSRDNINCGPGEGKQGVRIIDISNRNQPVSVGFAETIHGSHNLSVVGDTGYVYVSSYNLSDATAVDGVSIVDIRDPKNPTVRFLEFPDADDSPDYENMKNDSTAVLTSPGCHDIGIDMKRNLAYCGGITETQIWDIADPANPVIISTIINPLITIHHGANANFTGDVLVLDDEFAGAAGGPSGCAIEEAPTGALWFYDIKDPRSPKLMSYWSPDMTKLDSQFCTSHFFGNFPDRNWVAGSWYEEGVRIVDFSDPYNPVEKAFYMPKGAIFWSAYPYNGYIYANSFAPATLTGSDPNNRHAGGLYIFELDGFTKSDSATSK
jgi:hypothetical protein